MKKLTKKILLASLGTAAVAVTVPVVLTSCSTTPELKKDSKVETTFTYSTTINVSNTESFDNLKAYVEANKTELMKLILAEMNKDSAKFANISISYKETKDKGDGTNYSLVVTATPLENYAWADGTTTSKDVTVTLTDVKFNTTPPTDSPVAVTAKEQVTFVDSVASLFKEDWSTMTVGEMLNDKISKTPSLKSSFVNQTLNDNQLAALNVSVKNEKVTETWTGQAAYADWSKNTTKVYYSINSPQLTIKSTKDLQDQLKVEGKLAEIMKEAGIADTDKKTFTLADSKLNLDANKDFLNINVLSSDKAAGGATKADVQYDLMLPVSDLNFVIDKATVSLETTNDKLVTVETKDNVAKLTFDVGIDATSQYTSSTMDLGTSEINADNVLKQLKWANDKPASLYSSDSTDAIVLNQDKIAQDNQIFNVTFNEKVTLNNVEGKENTYTLSFVATPKEGYSWVDGTKDAKTVTTTELTITGKAAVVKDAEVKDFSYAGEVAITAKAGEEATKLKEWINDATNNKTLFDALTAKDTGNVNLKSIAIKTDPTKDGNNYKVVFTATPADGHDFADGATKEVTITFTNVKVTVATL